MGLVIKSLNNAINVVKSNGTKVGYHLFDEYEIHINTIPGNTKQEWHYHQQIEEVIIVTKGEMKVCYFEADQEIIKTVSSNDLILVKDSIHTFINDNDQDCNFIVFRLVLNGADHRKLFRNDKIVVNLENIVD